jgi:hypothetical protein
MVVTCSKVIIPKKRDGMRESKNGKTKQCNTSKRLGLTIDSRHYTNIGCDVVIIKTQSPKVPLSAFSPCNIIVSAIIPSLW